MLIVKIFGGLGNQMFQYALYRKLQVLGKEVFCDTQSLSKVSEQGFPIINIFPNTKIQVVSEEDRGRLGDVSKSLFSKVRRRVWRKGSHICENEEIKYFQTEILGMDEVYLDGYWQSESYFRDIRETLVAEFEFPIVSDRRNRELALEMRENNSVSVHFRRGDYLCGKVAKIHGGLCSDLYYEKAIGYFKEKYTDVHFYIFSNDPDWIKQHYNNPKMTIINWNNNANSYLEMYLMSQCHHNIIANSSFSWWGAWLNQNEKKEVIAPRFWFNPKYMIEKDTVCESWVRMDG